MLLTEIYHGSLCGNIGEFEDFTHFGTPEAAIAAAAAKAYAQPAGSSLTAYLYSVSIRGSSATMIHEIASDWGDPTLYSTLCKLLKTGKYPELESIKLRADDLRGTPLTRQGKIEAEKYLRGALTTTFQDRVVAFAYKNDVEDAGKKSYLVVRGESVKIIGIEEIGQQTLMDARPHLQLISPPTYQVPAHIQARAELRNQRPSPLPDVA